MSSDALIEEEWKPTQNPWIVTCVVMIATFIFVLDSTIANVALPHMAGSFGSSNEEAMWILTSYLIASGIVLPSVGWFSKAFGRKNFFINCIIIFTFASVLCGLAQSLGMMILARVIQGFGGGALLPVSQAIMLESFPKEKRGLAMSIFGLGVVVAPIIGPVLGGWITDNYNWSWVFYINLPCGLIAAFFAKLFIEDPPYARKQKLEKIDYTGFFFLTLWLITLQIFLDKGQNADWFNSDWICWLAGTSVVAMIIFVVSQLKNKDSIIDLSVFKDRNFAVGTIILVVVTTILYASIAIMPLFLQHLLGYSAFLSGYALMPRGLGSIVSVILCAALTGKVDDRMLVTVGLILLGTAGLMFGLLNLDISIMNIIVPNFIYGMGLGFCFIPITTLSVTTLENSKMTNATGIQNLLKNIGGAVGISIVTTLLSRSAQMHQYSMVGYLNDLNPVFTQKLSSLTMALAKYMNITVASSKANYLLYAELLKQSNLWAFMDAFRILGLMAFFVIPIIWKMKKPVHAGKSDMSALH